MKQLNKTILYAVAFAAAFCTFTCFGNDFGPMEKGSRKQNKDGNIVIEYARKETGPYIRGASLSIKDGQTTLPAIGLTNCQEFVDAKLDSSTHRVAIVFVDGLNLIYQTYSLTNQQWRLDQNVPLVEYNLAFSSFGNGLELSDFNTLRASFIKKGEDFVWGRVRGEDRPGDKVHFIKVTADGRVLIDGRERESMQWYPDR